MIGDKRMSKKVRYAAYKNAVAGSLVGLYGVDPLEAGHTAGSWWERLLKTSAIKSGIFLHVEPAQTAAELLGVKRRPLDGEDKLKYKQILKRSMDQARTEEVTDDNPPLVFEMKAKQTLQEKTKPEWDIEEPLQRRLKVRA